MLDITRGEFRCTTCSDHWSPDFSFDFGNSLHPQQPPPAASRVGLKFFTSAIIAYRTTQDSPGESSDFCSKISWRNYKQAYFTCFVHLHGNISGREHIYIYVYICIQFCLYICCLHQPVRWHFSLKVKKYPDTSACTFTDRPICTNPCAQTKYLRLEINTHSDTDMYKPNNSI